MERRMLICSRSFVPLGRPLTTDPRHHSISLRISFPLSLVRVPSPASGSRVSRRENTLLPHVSAETYGAHEDCHERAIERECLYQNQALTMNFSSPPSNSSFPTPRPRGVSGGVSGLLTTYSTYNVAQIWCRTVRMLPTRVSVNNTNLSWV